MAKNSFVLKNKEFFMSEKMVASDVVQTIFRAASAGAGSVLPLPLSQNVHDTGQWMR